MTIEDAKHPYAKEKIGLALPVIANTDPVASLPVINRFYVLANYERYSITAVYHT